MDGGIEEAFATAFGILAIALVLGNVGDETVIEAHLTGRNGVKGFVGVEVGPANIQAKTLQALERGLQVVFEIVGVMVVTSDERRGSDNVALPISDRQDVGRFRPFASLISHRFAAFLGDDVRPD